MPTGRSFPEPAFFFSSLLPYSSSLSLSLSLSLSRTLSGVCESVRRKKGEEEMKKGGERRIVREWGKERKEGESGREWAARGFWERGRK
jgi:hypothetical protein